jgi:hypothetical protein
VHYEFQPADAPDPADPDVEYGIPPEQITTELLELCEQFLRQASPLVHTELDEFLTTKHGHHGGLGWFLDALGFTTSTTPPRETTPEWRETASVPQP